jgi:hypothetical protein
MRTNLFMVLFTRGIFANICSLFPSTNFPTMIVTTQVAWFKQAIPYRFPSDTNHRVLQPE